jgi:hypothetical protein
LLDCLSVLIQEIVSRGGLRRNRKIRQLLYAGMNLFECFLLALLS